VRLHHRHELRQELGRSQRLRQHRRAVVVVAVSDAAVDAVIHGC